MAWSNWSFPLGLVIQLWQVPAGEDMQVVTSGRSFRVRVRDLTGSGGRCSGPSGQHRQGWGGIGDQQAGGGPGTAMGVLHSGSLRRHASSTCHLCLWGPQLEPRSGCRKPCCTPVLVSEQSPRDHGPCPRGSRLRPTEACSEPPLSPRAARGRHVQVCSPHNQSWAMMKKPLGRGACFPQGAPPAVPPLGQGSGKGTVLTALEGEVHTCLGGGARDSWEEHELLTTPPTGPNSSRPP